MITPNTLLDALTSHLHARRFIVAYSGGVDSTVLLHCLAQLRTYTALPPLCALHIHHGLSPFADAWQAQCVKNCAALQVECTSISVSLDDLAGKSVEDAAREARYRAFDTFVQAGDVLLLAHHQDDQAETLLLRLMRGAGVKGLAAMPPQRALGSGLLVRPFLEVTRNAIMQYALQHGLEWIEDESNAALHFDRNFLRHEIVPLLQKRWPQFAQNWARSAQLCRETDALCSEWGWLDFQNVQGAKPNTLSIKALQQLSDARRRNVLRYWLTQLHLPLPSQAQLKSVLTNVIAAKEDAQPLLSWPGVEIRRFQNQLYAMPPFNVQHSSELITWDARTPLMMSVGVLTATSAKGEGIALDKITAPLTVRYRKSGERCKPAGRVGSHPIKKLFQEYSVEPWLRDVWPLIFMGEQMVCAPGLWVCEGFEVQGKKAGLVVEVRFN